ncbi:MAG: hypothetical protein R3B45_09285 [Bdellovibrionota bacterium]
MRQISNFLAFIVFVGCQFNNKRNTLNSKHNHEQKTSDIAAQQTPTQTTSSICVKHSPSYVIYDAIAKSMKYCDQGIWKGIPENTLRTLSTNSQPLNSSHPIIYNGKIPEAHKELGPFVDNETMATDQADSSGFEQKTRDNLAKKPYLGISDQLDVSENKEQLPPSDNSFRCRSSAMGPSAYLCQKAH